MKNIFTITGLSFLLIACSTNTENNETKPKNEESKDAVVAEKNNAKAEKTISNDLAKVETVQYTGTYFSVKYPTNFTVSPAGPIETDHNDVKYIETDEAYFCAPDSSVVFYIYSPQWSGTPEAYVNKREHEKTVSTDKSEDKDGDLIITKESGSFEAIDGSYKRAFVSITNAFDGGSETKKVFGIQYRDQASYDKYRDSYKAFKKSLEQFAD